MREWRRSLSSSLRVSIGVDGDDDGGGEGGRKRTTATRQKTAVQKSTSAFGHAASSICCGANEQNNCGNLFLSREQMLREKADVRLPRSVCGGNQAQRSASDWSKRRDSAGSTNEVECQT
jgi:hypothetical protein